MISVASKSVERAEKELKSVAKTLNATLKIEFKVRNIVPVVNLDFEVDLYKIGALFSSNLLAFWYI